MWAKILLIWQTGKICTLYYGMSKLYMKHDSFVCHTSIHSNTTNLLVVFGKSRFCMSQLFFSQSNTNTLFKFVWTKYTYKFWNEGLASASAGKIAFWTKYALRLLKFNENFYVQTEMSIAANIALLSHCSTRLHQFLFCFSKAISISHCHLSFLPYLGYKFS